MAKYVVSIMDRYYMDTETFIYKTSHVAVGDIDEKTGIFTDKNGNEYLPMLDQAGMRSEIPYSYSNIIKLSDLREMYDGMSLKDAIKVHEYTCRRVIYLGGILDNGESFCIPFSMDQIRKDTEKAFEKARNKEIPEQPKEIKQETIVEKAEEPEYEQDQDQDSEKNPYFKRYDGEMNPDIASLILDIVNGVYSLSELKDLRENIKSESADIESLMDTLELQIEASEKGESFTKLKEEKIKEEQDEELRDKGIDPNRIKIKNRIDLSDLLKKVTKTLIAQDEPTRRVLAELARKEQSEEAKARGILLTGSTGVGKTKMMKLIAKYLDRPFYKIDATKLTVPGYTGTDIEEELYKLIIECGSDVNKAEQAIIFFDEIDKKGSGKKDDVSGKGVLNLLLPFIEGSKYDAVENMKSANRKITIDTSNMIVILGGAYTDVYKNLVEKSGIGFGANVEKGRTRKATPEDFVNLAQMTDEFMGRVAIVHLNDLDVDDLIRVITDSDESSLKIQQKLFDELGVKLTAGDDFVRQIAENAYKRKTGARGLNTVVEDATWEAYYDAYDNIGKYEEIILTKDTVEDPKQYTKVLRKESN